MVNSQYPKISIVTPNYNLDNYLEKTIQSVIYQGYPNLEYIIIDGGSTDASINIIKKYEQYISYWISEKDDGLYDALNKGFTKATGEIFMYVNSDDCLIDGSLNLIGKCFFKFPTIAWLTGFYSFLNEKGEIIKIKENINWSIIDYLCGNFKWIQQESTVWRKETWEKAGGKFNTNYKYAADMALWCEFFLQENPIIADFSVGAFRVRDNQLSKNNADAYDTEAMAAIEYLKERVDSSILKKAKKHSFIEVLIRSLKKSLIFDNNIIFGYLNKYKKTLRKPSYRITYIEKDWELYED